MLVRWFVCILVLSGIGPRLASAETERLEGRIMISVADNGGEQGSGIEAVFAHSPAWGSVLATDGPCTLRARPADEGRSAGTIKITGTTQPITLEAEGMPGGTRYRPTARLPQHAFAADAPITVDVEGSADVPAFTASITAPPELTEYRRPRRVVSRNGYTATWQPRPGTEIVTMIGVLGSARVRTLLVCRVPDTGSFTVPASAFALIPPAGKIALVSVARLAETVQTVGQTVVTIDVMSAVISRPVALAEAVPTGYPRRFLSTGLAFAGVSRNGDVPALHGTGYRLQFGQHLGCGFHLVEEAAWFKPDVASDLAESQRAYGIGVRWTPFASRRLKNFAPRGIDRVLPVFGSVFEFPALYVTALVGANERTRVTQMSAGSTSADAWSPMMSLAVGFHRFQGHDWGLGPEFREQLTRYDGHFQRGWMLLLAVHVNDW